MRCYKIEMTKLRNWRGNKMSDYKVYVYENIKRYGRERKVFVCKFETVLEAQSFVSNKRA